MLLEKRYNMERICNRPLLIFVLLWSCAEAKDHLEGEFVAGSFILTQKSLSEAPHRYAKVLRSALDKVANGTMNPYVEDDFTGFLKICKVRIDKTGEMRPE